MNIKHHIIALLIVLAMTTPASAFDEWSERDIALEFTWVTINLVDWSQTRWMAQHDWKWNKKCYHENNPVLGKYPKVSEVDLYFAAGTLLHIGVTHVLPKEYRPYWQYVWIIGSSVTVMHNNRLGAGLRFEF